MKSFRDRLMDRDLLLGTFVTLPCPEIVEILVTAGIDRLFIDMEHGPLALESTAHQVQEAEGRCPCLARVPANTELETRDLLKWALFPPEGNRSIGAPHPHGRRIQESISLIPVI